MRKTYVLVYLLLFFFPLTFSVHRACGASTTVSVDPASSTVNVGNTFSVNINVTNVDNFTAWQLNLYYLNGVVNCTDATEGQFLRSGGTPYGTNFSKTITNNYNNTHGLLSAYSTMLGNSSYAAKGSGVIMTVTFKAVGGESTALVLSDIELGDGNIRPHPIDNTPTDGTVSVTGGVHNIAVTNVTSAKTVVCQGYTANITVTVENKGNSVETFNTTCSINATNVQNKTINNMPSGTSANLTFVWNTTGFVKGNYTISAYATPVLGETNIGDNLLPGGIIRVTMVGDLQPEFGFVDMKDIRFVAARFGAYPNWPNWDANADITNDGLIDMKDVRAAAKNFGQIDP